MNQMTIIIIQMVEHGVSEQQSVIHSYQVDDEVITTRATVSSTPFNTLMHRSCEIM
jgi:hypothetical protein